MNNQAKHTPGPWTFQRSSETIISKHPDHNYSMIAKIATGEADAEEIANARLIAAAPELLEACKAVASLTLNYEAGSKGGNALATLRAAIAKAQGGGK